LLEPDFESLSVDLESFPLALESIFLSPAFEEEFALVDLVFGVLRCAHN
jgi:hypothetical protein